MKKVLLFLMILALTLCMFAGCSSANDPNLNNVTGSLGGNVSTGGNGGDTTPDGGDTTTPDGGDTTTPDGGDPTTPDGGDTTTPNGGDTTTPDGGDTPAPDGGDTTEPEEEGEKDYSDYITVVSYNVKSLQMDKGGVVEALKQMDGDIVGLQEIDYMNPRTANEDQMKYLANALGYPYYYYANCQGNYGHGFLSRYIIKEVEEHTYASFVGSEVRKYTRAILDVNGTEVVFYNTHLTTGTWEQTGTQYKELLTAVYKEKRPTVVTGDFNLTLIEQSKRLNTAEAFPLYGGELMIIDHKDYSYDNILIRNISDYYWDTNKDIGTKIMITEASDHYPIYSYIKVK